MARWAAVVLPPDGEESRATVGPERTPPGMAHCFSNLFSGRRRGDPSPRENVTQIKIHSYPFLYKKNFNSVALAVRRSAPRGFIVCVPCHPAHVPRTITHHRGSVGHTGYRMEKTQEDKKVYVHYMITSKTTAPGETRKMPVAAELPRGAFGDHYFPFSDNVVSVVF